MSKRDEMRKLREMRMKQLSETDRSTPAEEAAERAEAAVSETRESATSETKEKAQVEQSSDHKAVSTLADTTDYAVNMAREATKCNSKETSPETTDDKSNDIMTKKAENTKLTDASTNDVSYKSTAKVESSAVARLDYSYKAKDQNCGLTHTTIMLTQECMNILKTRSLQMGMTQQDYFNMLIEEDKTVVDNATDELTPNEKILDMIDLHGKKSKNITVTEDNYKFMKKAAALRGISQTNYANYIILKEHLREQTEGRRPGKYD